MIALHSAKLYNPASIQTLDNYIIRSVIFIDIMRSDHSFPRSSEDQIRIAIFDNEDMLLYLDTPDIYVDIMTNSNRLSFFEECSCLCIITVNPPIDRRIDLYF